MAHHVTAQSFLFVRHGQTRWNVERRLQGRSDIPLNETGLEQAHTCAALLRDAPIAAIITSPLQRAHQTALALAAQTGAAVTVDPQLIERSFGDYEGRLVEEVRPAHVDGVAFCAMDLSEVGAEPWSEVCARVAASVNKWTAEHRQEQVVFVSHYGLFTALCAILLGAPVAAKNAAPYRFSKNPDWRIADLSEPQFTPAGQP